MTTLPTTYELQIGRNFVTVRSLAEASSIYSRIRDKSCMGASEFPFGTVWQGDIAVASVSYNGRVWACGEGIEQKKLIMEAAR